MKLDEKHAPPDASFDEANSAPVVLADGQTWYVPKPWLEVRPVFRGGKPSTAYRVLTCGAGARRTDRGDGRRGRPRRPGDRCRVAGGVSAAVATTS